MCGRSAGKRHMLIVTTAVLVLGFSAAATSAFGTWSPEPLVRAPEIDVSSAEPSERSNPIHAPGFLDLQFVHGAVTVDNSIYHRTLMVNPDSLGAYIQHLQDYGTRNSHTTQILAAGRWLMNRLSGLGYEDAIIEPIDIGGAGSGFVGNVVASKAGSTVPEIRIIVGGHYDSIGSGGPTGGTAPGADDNASGTAATLEIARLLSEVELDATVQYVLFAGEEQGLHGSRDFAEGLLEQGVEQDKVFFINMDMIGHVINSPWGVKIGYGRITRPLAELISGVAGAYTTLEPQLLLGVGASDHVPFEKNGYPAVLIHEGDFNPYYHTAEDLLEHLNMEYESEVVRMVMATVLHLGILAPPPDDVVASQTAAGEVLVEWSHSPDADVVGYHVEVFDDAGQVLGTVFTREDYAILPPETLGTGAWLRVRSEDVLGEGEASETVFVGTGEAIVSVAKPNPTSAMVRLEIFIPGSGHAVNAAVKIVDATGRLVYSIHDDLLSRGSHTLEWNGTYTSGEAAAPGIYFYVIEADGLGRAGGKIAVVR